MRGAQKSVQARSGSLCRPLRYSRHPAQSTDVRFVRPDAVTVTDDESHPVTVLLQWALENADFPDLDESPIDGPAIEMLLTEEKYAAVQSGRLRV